MKEGAKSLGIGRPIANTRIYILDSRGEPVPIGAVGEIHIGGAGVALGYLNRPELTAERFRCDPFAPDPGARMYKTGDLGRYRSDGSIEFLGRNDAQVKIRGFRIEPGEIEARLKEHDQVGEAVVAVREDSAGDRRLVAYYTARATPQRPSDSMETWAAEDGFDAEQLRKHLGRLLPEYMVPVAYVRLDAWPLTPHGKVDRTGLPAPERAAYGNGDFEAPIGDVETTLARLWSELLKVERVGRRDNFFSLGGHSLLAVRLMQRMQQEALRADVPAVFAARTLEALAAVTEKLKRIVL